MIRSNGAFAGFNQPTATIASSRLTSAIAATLTLGALALGLIGTLTVVSIKVSMAMACPI